MRLPGCPAAPARSGAILAASSTDQEVQQPSLSAHRAGLCRSLPHGTGVLGAAVGLVLLVWLGEGMGQCWGSWMCCRNVFIKCKPAACTPSHSCEQDLSALHIT